MTYIESPDGYDELMEQYGGTDDPPNYEDEHRQASREKGEEKGEEKEEIKTTILDNAYGATVPSDLAVLLGALEENSTCWAWQKEGIRDHACICGLNRDFGTCSPWVRYVSTRPAIRSSVASKISLKNVHKAEGVNGIQYPVGEYGEYPQTIVSEEKSDQLEELYESKSLHRTKKYYTFDSADELNIVEGPAHFKATSYPEYEMDGKKYIRVLGCPCDTHCRLSTRERVRSGKPYWVEVQPIEWWIDPTGWLVARKCLFAGIPFALNERECYGDFSKSFIKKYLRDYFDDEMLPTKEYFKAMGIPTEKPKKKEAEKPVSKKKEASYTLSETLKKASDVNITIKPDKQNN